jgi:benzoylformate decarboxylase
MRSLLRQYLEQDLSRRDFAKALVAIGFSASAINAVLRSEAMAESQAAAEAFEVEGSGGMILVECLKAAGIEYVFDCNSTGQNPFYDALSVRPEIKLIVALQEGQATSMAHGYELASGRVSALFVPSIGTPNAIGNMYNAWKDRSAIAVFADGRDSTFAGRDGFQQLDNWLQPTEQITKWRWQVNRAERIGELARRAIKLASTPPGGPVYIRIPSNVLNTTGVKETIYPQSDFNVPVRMEPRADLIEQTARLLIEAKQPMINAGPEVTRAGANRELLELAELLAIPVAQGFSVYGDFPYQHPLSAGFFSLDFPRGLGGTDVLFNLGAHMPDSTIWTGMPKVDHIVNARLEYDKIANIYPTDIAIAAGAKETLQALIDSVNSMATERRIEEIRMARMADALKGYERSVERRKKRAEKTWNDSPIATERLCYEFEQSLDEDATIVCETGDRTPQQWLNVGPGRKSLIGPTTGSCLGWCIGASLGVKIARPNNQVVAMVGDGAMLFGQIESLWTASRYDIPVIIVVFDNRSYDGERGRLHMFSKMENKALWKDMSCYLGDPDIDYVSIAKGFDIDGQKISKPDEIQSALQRAIAVTREGRPFLIDAVIARKGAAADSTWHPDISIAAGRTRKV